MIKRILQILKQSYHGDKKEMWVQVLLLLTQIILICIIISYY